MDVEPKIGVVFTPPKWMVKIMENPNPMNKWMIWGGFPIIFGNTHIGPIISWLYRNVEYYL